MRALGLFCCELARGGKTDPHPRAENHTVPKRGALKSSLLAAPQTGPHARGGALLQPETQGAPAPRSRDSEVTDAQDGGFQIALRTDGLWQTSKKLFQVDGLKVRYPLARGGGERRPIFSR